MHFLVLAWLRQGWDDDAEPPTTMRNLLNKYSLALLICGLLVSGVLLAESDANAAYAKYHTPLKVPRIQGLPQIEALVLQYTNRERKAAGKKPLKLHPKLTAIARMHSHDMMSNSYREHLDSAGRMPVDRLHAFHPELMGGVGENVAYIELPTEPPAIVASEFVKEWMDSAGGHRENLLREDWNYIGIGVVKQDGIYFGTQFFGELLAELENPLPLVVPPGKETLLRFKFHGAFPRQQVVAVVYFPDKQAKHVIGDRYSLGVGQYDVKWKGNSRFEFKLKADKGHGHYRINIGRAAERMRVYRSMLLLKAR